MKVETSESDAGRWEVLYDQALATAKGPKPGRELSDEERAVAAAERACQLVREGEVSHARQALVGMPLAPGDDETLWQLKNIEARPEELTEALPEDLRTYVPPTDVQLSKHLLLQTFAGPATRTLGRAVRHAQRSLEGVAA